jgi:hypothetical protein
MAHYWRTSDPHSLVSVCDRRQAEQLVGFDHHQVVVNGCWGILITYPWMPLETAQEPLIATVFFNPAPRHTTSEDRIRTMIRKHPLAPPEIQAIVDQLSFRLSES